MSSRAAIKAAHSGAQQDLYPANPTPTTTQGNQGAPGSFGMKFSTNTPGLVQGVKWHQVAGSTTARSIGLYALDGTALATASVTGASGWNSGYFGTAIYILPNVIYVAVMYNAEGSFSANYSSMSSDFTVGVFTCKANNSGGQYNGVWDFSTGIKRPANTDTTVSPKIAVSPIFQPT